MKINEAYDLWSGQYDANKNRTRDVEGLALQEMVGTLHVDRCLEIGCGTGKNTTWLATRAHHVMAVDFSEQMLAKAKTKVQADHVQFHQADITHPWSFTTGTYDLITFSLVLEHIEHLKPVFEKASKAAAPGGYVYVGELHPFKQYASTKARFDTPEGTQTLTCFTHHVTDFTSAATQHGFTLAKVEEYFDENDRTGLPRILAFLFRKI